MSSAGQYPGSLLAGLEWRDVGPMRGGRTYGVAGHANQPDTFYFGSVGGGVWKTENSGHTWYPDFRRGHSHRLDRRHRGGAVESPMWSTWAPASPISAASTPTGSACSSPRTRARPGPTSASKPRARSDAWWWTRRIRIACMSRRSATCTSRTRSAASIARPTAARPGRRSCSRPGPDNVGAIDLAIDPKNPRVLYASLWATRRPPWSVYAPTNLPGGGLYKSTDGGDTWKQLTGGLPTDEFVGKIGIAVAPSNPNRLWAVVDDTGSGVAVRRRRRPRRGAAARQPPAAESTSPMTPAPPGSWSTARTGCGAAAGTSKPWPSIPPTPTAPTSSTPPLT